MLNREVKNNNVTESEEKNIPAHELPADFAIQPDVLSCGAGIASLWTMICLKTLEPNKEILMFDKYLTKSHTHTLVIGNDAFEDWRDHPQLHKLIESVPGRIRYHELRKIFMEYACSIGIKIENYPVTNTKELLQRFPTTQILIGGDGARSNVHQEIFNGEYSYQKDHNYLAFLRYEIEDKSQPLDTFRDKLPALSQCKHTVFEIISKPYEGKSLVTLQIFLEKETYDKLMIEKQASRLNYQSLSSIDPELMSTVNAWLKERKKKLNEKLIPETERFSVTNLSVHCTKDFVKPIPNGYACVDGDARLGLIYFRGLTVSLKSSFQLATAISNYFSAKKQYGAAASWVLGDPFASYSRYMFNIANSEIKKASRKNFGVQVIQFSTKTLQTPLIRSSFMASEKVRDEAHDTSLKISKKLHSSSEESSLTRKNSKCSIM